MVTITLQKPSLAELYSYIEQTQAGYWNIFRGQPDAEFNLTPGLYRNKPPFHTDVQTGWKKDFERYESNMVSDFFNRALPYLPPFERSFRNDRVICQHYGVPTQLLDWSNDPLVGLFFAIQGFNPDKLNRNAKKRNEVGYETEKDGAFFMIRINAFANYNSTGLDSNDDGDLLAMNPPIIDARVAAQRSVFTFQKYIEQNEEYVPIDKRDLGKDYNLVKIVIPGDMKPELHKLLVHIGIDRSFIFPGLDGIGQTIKLKSYEPALFV